MRKLLILALLLLSINLVAQVSEGGLPPSFKNTMAKSKAQIAAYSLNKLDTAQLLAYDRENPTPMRYSVIKDVSIDLKLHGTKTYLESYKGNIWQYRITAEEAKSVQIIFEKYRVPDNAQLFIYDENYSLIRGAFTSLNITEDLSFVIADFPGENLIIEYFEPLDSQFEGELVIGGIGQAYIDIFETKSINADYFNLINVNCIEGEKWQNQKHAVVKITFSGYLCTGSLINNTNNDGTPYFLTANHCLSTTEMASTVVAWFNYENAGCTDNSIYSNQTLSGATLKTTGTGSDYTLLQLDDSHGRLKEYLPYFAGWDITGAVTDSTTGIHHPKGWVKKISIDHGPSGSNTQSISWEGGGTSAIGTHWAVTFDEGTTYGGSSGSPLFDEYQRVIGQLHGGGTIDFYGKLSYSWTHPSVSFPTLKSFLDPTNSGVQTLDAYYPAINKTDPQFVSDFDAVCVAAPVTLKGYSAFNPTGWQWSFSPATVTYHNGTSAASQNPDVSFNTAGLYDITLTATNAAGSSERTMDDLVSAGTSLNLSIMPSGISDSCACSFTGVKLTAYGSDAYEWTLTGDAANYFTISNSTANPVEILPVNPLESQINITLTLTGLHGTCSNSVNYSLPLAAPANDNVANAILLSNSNNGPYSNKCATVETGEPVPPCTDCTGQLSWCDEYGDGTKLAEHSVWFYYVPATAETVSISSTGFDNQIAVYQADSFSDVLSGAATLIAANDDYTATNFNPNVTGMKFNSNKKYWIQVDGSGGGTTGTFFLKITALNGIEDIESKDLNISVYPQPACDNVFIQSPEFEGAPSVIVELFNASGSKISSETKTEGNSTIEVPLSGLSSGLYFVRLTFNEKRTTVKIIK